LVRTWIEAGVSYDLLRQSKMSRSSADYCVSIEHPRGPTVWRPGWASDFIVVTRAQGRACREVFSLREIYDSISGQTATGLLLLFQAVQREVVPRRDALPGSNPPTDGARLVRCDCGLCRVPPWH